MILHKLQRDIDEIDYLERVRALTWDFREGLQAVSNPFHGFFTVLLDEASAGYMQTYLWNVMSLPERSSPHHAER